MAKKKKKADAKKAKGVEKLPKAIAGIKVPKNLRAPGGKLLKAVQNPLVIDAAAAALMAAAGALRNSKSGASDGGSSKTPKPAGDLGAILAATAIEGVRRLGEGAARQKKGNGTGAPDAKDKG